VLLDTGKPNKDLCLKQNGRILLVKLKYSGNELHSKVIPMKAFCPSLYRLVIRTTCGEERLEIFMVCSLEGFPSEQKIVPVLTQKDTETSTNSDDSFILEVNFASLVTPNELMEASKGDQLFLSRFLSLP